MGIPRIMILLLSVIFFCYEGAGLAMCLSEAAKPNLNYGDDMENFKGRLQDLSVQPPAGNNISLMRFKTNIGGGTELKHGSFFSYMLEADTLAAILRTR